MGIRISVCAGFVALAMMGPPTLLRAALLLGPPAGARNPSQQSSGRVVDRIVARIEGDIILQSQVRELSAFQQLVDGKAQADDRVLAELIEQWIVQTEAVASFFPQPSRSDVDREMARLVAQFPSSAPFAARLGELSLSDAQVQQLLERQIYFTRYLDYKYRPSAQIELSDITTYYQTELIPQMKQKNQAVPPLTEMEGQIRELLTQRKMNELAAKWLDETKSRLKIQVSIAAD